MKQSMAMWSRYNSETIARERVKLAQAEHEVNQEKGEFITEDDILNLRILIETSSSFDFIKGVTSV